MPKKTKKQKILADLRRQNYKIPTVSFKTESAIKTPLVPIQQVKTDQNQTQSIYFYPVQLIRKDLTKTLLLCILAISLEVALYFILEKNLVLPFK